jgi:hypothetical protein
MHHPTIGSTKLECVFTHCQNWQSACAKMTVVDILLSPVCQKAPRGRRGAFVCWNAYRREFPRVRDIGQSAAWQWGNHRYGSVVAQMQERKQFVVTCKDCHRPVPSGVKEFPFQSIIVTCPLCGKQHRYLPSEVSLGRPDRLMVHQQRTVGR